MEGLQALLRKSHPKSGPPLVGHRCLRGGWGECLSTWQEGALNETLITNSIENMLVSVMVNWGPDKKVHSSAILNKSYFGSLK